MSYVEMRDDGSISIPLLDGDLVLRRPTMREYRDFRNAISAHVQKVARIDTDVERSEHEEQVIRDEIDDRQTAIMLDVVKRLGDRDLGDNPDDVMPAWLLRIEQLAQWSNHWAVVPLAPGPAVAAVEPSAPKESSATPPPT